MYSRVTITNSAGIVGAFNTHLTSTNPVAERWVGAATDLAGEAGYIFTSDGTTAYDFPLKLTVTYVTGNNFITLRSAELFDMAGATNLFTNASMEADTLGVPDDWTAGVLDVMVSTVHKYMESQSAFLTNTDPTDDGGFYQVPTLTAANYILSAYVKPAAGTVIADVALYAQPDLDPLDYTALVTIDSTTALEDGWYRIAGNLTGTAADWKAGIVLPAGKHAYVDGLMIELKAGSTPTAFTNYEGAAQVKGAVLRNGSGDHNVYYSLDESGVTANHIFLHINADKDSISFVLGNDDSDDGVNNAAFYGRLITPSGDPADSGNSTGVDVTSIAIGTSCRASDEGKMSLYRDANGNFWQEYVVFDNTVDSHEVWGGSKWTKYNTWGQRTLLPFIKDLFVKDLYWKDKVNFIGLFHEKEGFRGYLPKMFTINEALDYSGVFNVFITPKHLIRSGTATGGDANTLTDTGTDFTTGTAVKGYDVIYQVSTGDFGRVDPSAIAANSIDTLANFDKAWATGAEYEIYRGIAFDVLSVGFAPGETIKPNDAGALADNSYNQFTPYNRRRHHKARRRKIVLSE